MIIDLRNILHGPRRLDFSREPDWWKGDEEDDQIQGLEGPLKARIDLSREGEMYLLEGEISSTLRIRCDRCLEPYPRDLRSVFKVFLSAPAAWAAESERQLVRGDMSFEFITGNSIDVDGVVREQIYLSLPMKCLCREDCRGLCAGCGANLNKEKCECPPGDGHPGFSILKKLKNR